MQTVKLKFTKIGVPEFEKKGLLLVRFHYTVNGGEKVLEKQYGYLNEDPLTFAKDVVAEVKNKCRKSAGPSLMDDGILSGYVNLQMVEEKEEQSSERIANALKQVRDKIRTIKTMAHANNYMSRYIEVKGLILEL